MNLPPCIQALETCFGWVWKTSLQTTVLIALVWLVQRVFKRVLAPRWRYALGLLVVLRLALPVVPAATFSVFSLVERVMEPAGGMGGMGGMGSMGSMGGMGGMGLAQSAILPVPTRAATAPTPAHSARLPLPGLVWLAGCVVILGATARQHWKLTRQLRGQPPLDTPRILALLEECKGRLGVKRAVTVLSSATLNTPALFGSWRPRLLIPEAMLERLDDCELRLIFLHELTHLKRGDILLNWTVIFLRALHWFNPAVWFAMRRLRADQELACDAAVMARLAADERRLYGDTLIKLLSDFSASPFCPGLVPFFTNKQVIKRRITMISKFKPASRFALVASVTLIIALGCFTFTRAADNANDSSRGSSSGSTPAAVSAPGAAATASEAIVHQIEAYDQGTDADKIRALKEHDEQLEVYRLKMATKQAEEAQKLKAATEAPERTARIEASVRRLDVLRTELETLTANVNADQARLSALRKQLGIPNDIAEGTAVSKVDAETMRHYDSILQDSETQYIRESKLLSQFKELSPGDLKNALPTAAPDAILTQLMQDELAAKSKLASLRADFGEQNPEVVRVVKLQTELAAEISDRIKGILSGMEMHVNSLKAVVDDVTAKVKAAKMDDNEALDKYQPYFRMKHDLEILQKTRDDLMTRVKQEGIERDLLLNAPQP